MSRRRHETLEEFEMRTLREAAERRDERRNETLTRGEVLDAIESVANECFNNEMHSLLCALRDALR